MTSVFNGKIRRWYISKSASSNCGNERYIAFTEFKPTIIEQGQEWIPVISLDDFHKEVNINISRWVEVCQELVKLQAELAEKDEEIKQLKKEGMAILAEKNRAIKKAIEYIEIADYGCDCSNEFYQEIADFLKKYGEDK